MTLIYKGKEHYCAFFQENVFRERRSTPVCKSVVCRFQFNDCKSPTRHTHDTNPTRHTRRRQLRKRLPRQSKAVEQFSSSPSSFLCWGKENCSTALGLTSQTHTLICLLAAEGGRPPVSPPPLPRPRQVRAVGAALRRGMGRPPSPSGPVVGAALRRGVG